MRCLFCKRDSSSSISREHIIPESLGNSLHTLPPGVVCDACNNYFSRNVEKPFLESGTVKSLRFEQGLVNKKGRIPSTMGFIIPDRIAARITRDPRDLSKAILEVASEEAKQVIAQRLKPYLFVPLTDKPSDTIVSRFLAKMALEALAFRLASVSEGLDYLVDEEQLDSIRSHAKRGSHIEWPYLMRQIYDRDKPWHDTPRKVTQVLHEFDVLATASGEWYFVVAIFGAEFVINYAGPFIDGYMRWLEQNGHSSPLYVGKNAGHSYAADGYGK